MFQLIHELLSKGDLFIPFRGEHVNGHRYVQDAIDKGAVASFWLKDEPNPPEDIPLFLSKIAEKALQEMARVYREDLNVHLLELLDQTGKRLRRILVASVLSPYFNVRKTEGNFNNELGLPLTILSLRSRYGICRFEMGMSGFGEI